MNDLQVATGIEMLSNEFNKAIEEISKFNAAFLRVFPKKYKKQKAFDKKVSDLQAEICIHLFEEGILCKNCDLNRNTCEGSNCGNQMESYFESCTDAEAKKEPLKLLAKSIIVFQEE